jgi:hypothetical protein
MHNTDYDIAARRSTTSSQFYRYWPMDKIREQVSVWGVWHTLVNLHLKWLLPTRYVLLSVQSLISIMASDKITPDGQFMNSVRPVSLVSLVSLHDVSPHLGELWG